MSAAGGDGTGGPVAPELKGAIGGQPTGVPGVTGLTVHAGPGDDTVIGTAGNDEIRGGPGNDTLVAGGGIDKLFGEDGDDRLDGGPGNDNPIDGGPGDDVIDEGPTPNGNDAIAGGDGHDTVDYSKRVGVVTIGPANASGVRPVGEAGEQDRVAPDVEEVRRADQAGTGTVSGLRIHEKTLPALAGCEGVIGAVDDDGPCPLLVDPQHRLGFTRGGREHDSVGSFNDTTHVLRVLNLESLTTIIDVEIKCSGPGRSSRELCIDPNRAALDPGTKRIYQPVTAPMTIAPGDPAGCSVLALDYSTLPAAPRALPPLVYDTACRSPFTTLSVAVDAERRALYLTGTYAHAPHQARDHKTQPWGFAVGVAEAGNGGFTGYLRDNLGAPLIIRKVTIAPDGALAHAFDLDLRYAGCARRQIPDSDWDTPRLAAFVAQVGESLLAYCWDPKLVYWQGSPLSGEQGYLVRIPLKNGSPVARDGGELRKDPSGSYLDYRSVRTPTLPGYLRVFADEAGGQVFLTTSGSLNGNAVYVFDIANDRFVGVVTGGASRIPKGNQAVGFDPTRGRVYSLTVGGVLRVPARQRPLPAGEIVPVAANPGGAQPIDNWVNYAQIHVVPDLHRLIVPLNLPWEGRGRPHGLVGARYLVIDDVLADPPPPVAPDPDANTAQVEEGEGTEVAARGQASASGAHVVVTGGVTRTLDSADPGCRLFVAVSQRGDKDINVALERSLFGNGECASAQALAQGHRELSLSATSADAGSGSVAQGSPLSFDENDVTNRDVKAAGDCEIGLANSLARGNIPQDRQAQWREGCHDFWDGMTGRGEGSVCQPLVPVDCVTPPGSGPPDPRDPRNQVPDPRAGTEGRDGRGFALPAASCTDFSGVPDDDAAERDPLSAATAACDDDASEAVATASAAGFSITAGDTVVSVARTSSSATTARSAEGQVTTAVARAEGVVVGPLSVREIRSVAITRAKGRTGSAEVQIERRWCGVTLEGVGIGDPPGPPKPGPGWDPGCIDPTSPENALFVETLNQVLLAKVRLGVTDANGRDGKGEASPGGYQAVLIKHPDARGGDQTVNDDDSHTVAGMEITLYNDGAQGRNRYVVQLAGVHAESRYGVTVLPAFSGFSFSGSFTSTKATPSTRRVLPGRKSLPRASTLIEGESFDALLAASPVPQNPVQRFLQWVPDAVKDLLRLLIQHPLEFALLFLVFSLLATPGYLAYRRRQLLGVIT